MAVPGSLAVERFEFTVHDDATAAQINKLMGRRVALHYEQRSACPAPALARDAYFVNRVELTDEIPLAPNIGLPNLPAGVPAAVALRSMAIELNREAGRGRALHRPPH